MKWVREGHAFWVSLGVVCLCRDHWQGNDKRWLDRTTVRQMAGRAGRSGLDKTGEAILIVGRKYLRQADAIGKLIQALLCLAYSP